MAERGLAHSQKGRWPSLLSPWLWDLEWGLKVGGGERPQMPRKEFGLGEHKTGSDLCLRKHSGTHEAGLLEWREAGSREAVWQALAKILMRDNDSRQGCSFVLSFFSFLFFFWFPKSIENFKTRKILHKNVKLSLVFILLYTHTHTLEIGYLFVKPVACDHSGRQTNSSGSRRAWCLCL